MDLSRSDDWETANYEKNHWLWSATPVHAKLFLSLFFKQVWQSSEKRCVLAICSHVCLCIVSLIVWVHVFDAFVQIKPWKPTFQKFNLCVADGRTDGRIYLLKRRENACKIISGETILKYDWLWNTSVSVTQFFSSFSACLCVSAFNLISVSALESVPAS